MKYKYILFDLDGTLSESARGIRYSLEKTCEKFNISGIDFSDYTSYVGPPLLDTFKNLCKLEPELWNDAYKVYMGYYADKGIYMNKAYSGIKDVLKELKAKGLKLAVCSSKLEENAKKVVEIIGLKSCFDAVCGSNLDSSRKDKKDLIPYALKKLGGNRDEAVLIGDTYFDAQGAKRCNTDFIACSYGYGNLNKMLKYDCVAVADAPSDILDFIK